MSEESRTCNNSEFAKFYRLEARSEVMAKSFQVTIDLTSRSKKFDVGLVAAGPETTPPFCARFAPAHHLRRFQRDHLVSQKLDLLDCEIPLREANANGPFRGFQLRTRIFAARCKHHKTCFLSVCFDGKHSGGFEIL